MATERECIRRLRKPVLYPLSYEGAHPSCPLRFARQMVSDASVASASEACTTLCYSVPVSLMTSFPSLSTTRYQFVQTPELQVSFMKTI